MDSFGDSFFFSCFFRPYLYTFKVSLKDYFFLNCNACSWTFNRVCFSFLNLMVYFFRLRLVKFRLSDKVELELFYERVIREELTAFWRVSKNSYIPSSFTMQI